MVKVAKTHPYMYFVVYILNMILAQVHIILGIAPSLAHYLIIWLSFFGKK